MTELYTNIGSGLELIVENVGDVLYNITSSSGSLYTLLPLLGLGIGVTLFFAGIKVVRSFVFGG